MRIIIDSTEVKTKEGTNDKGPWAIRTQVGYADKGKRYPSEIKIRLKGDAPAWPVGEYTINDNESSYVSKYGSLALSEELVLEPATATVRKVA